MLNAVDSGTFNEERIREIEQRQKDLLLAMPLRYKQDNAGSERPT